MQWIARLNEAMEYLENHLTEEIDYRRLGQIACCSSYHFQRMFTYMAGIPLSEYVRRRRMTLAAVDVQNGLSVLEAALKYGYNSPTAFNRAFRSVHGMAPSAVRQTGVTLRSYQPICFQITIKGVEALQYRIEKKEAFQIVGVSTALEPEIEKNFETVPRLWSQAAMDGTLERLAALMEPPVLGILGVCAAEDRKPWRYYISVCHGGKPEGLEAYTVPAFTWAVFPGEGPCPQAIQQLERQVVTEWLPTSGYEFADGPDVEVYLTSDPQNSRFEVWIPVKPK